MRSCMQIMLKPASGKCNLRCKYCFYIDETKHREKETYDVMSEDTLRAIFEKCLAECRKELNVCFQGGEPTLAGLEFYKRAAVLSDELNVNHCSIHFAIQTNATLLNEEWCRFFKEHHYLVGVSLDGTKDIHDSLRVDSSGKGTFNQVVNSIHLLEKYGVDFNILTVLTPWICRSYRKIYAFYEKNGWNYQQYIPCLDPIGEERGQRKWSLLPERYEEYLKTAFDCWYNDIMAGKKKYHRYFDNLLDMLCGIQPEVCGMCGFCGNAYVIEADGSVFPCDFYMLDHYCLGNFNKDSISDLELKRQKCSFYEEGLNRSEKCAVCKWGALCRGGCRRDRDYFDGRIGENYYCSAMYSFFEYAEPKLRELYNSLVLNRTIG